MCMNIRYNCDTGVLTKKHKELEISKEILLQTLVTNAATANTNNDYLSQ